MSRVVRGGFPDSGIRCGLLAAARRRSDLRGCFVLAEEFKGSQVELNPDFRDLLRLLNQNDVKYLIVGSYAVM
jgi:hypothetical protein